MVKVNNKVLIVSNNVLSTTNNNGKTLLSLFQGINKERIQQLYFSSEVPSISGYSYFQISDTDVLRYYFNPNKKGRVWDSFSNFTNVGSVNSSKVKIVRNVFTCFARDLLWLNSWKSKKIIKWLDEFSPDLVFFVAGDTGFTYNIVNYIIKRYKCNLITYITDDYIMNRKTDSFIGNIRRLFIRRKMVQAIQKSDTYFTISRNMQKAYADITNKNSNIIMNITESLYDSKFAKNDSDCIHIVYAGSLYYGRNKIIRELGKCINKINPCTRKICIEVYSNQKPENQVIKELEETGVCKYNGSLNFEELKKIYNVADFLLFVENFDLRYKEKTMYSLSTKISEYLSVGKPILAIGPRDVGSMMYLQDVAFCLYDLENMDEFVRNVFCNTQDWDIMGKKARNKFKKDNDPMKLHEMFYSECKLL